MGEIITLHIGGAGVHFGEEFWAEINGEHGIDPSGQRLPAQNGNLDVFYAEGDINGPKYCPRVIMIDCGSDPFGQIQSGSLGSFFRPDCYLKTESSGGLLELVRKSTAICISHPNSAVAECRDEIEALLSSEAERCDSLAAFQVIHSLGGGAGSGIIDLVTSAICGSYPDKLTITHSILPVSNPTSPIEPYNTIFCLDRLIGWAQGIVLYQQPIASHLGCKTFPPGMAAVTAPFRFCSDGLNSTVRRWLTNFAFAPEMHLFGVSRALIGGMPIQEATETLFSGPSSIATLNLNQGRCFAGSLIVHGACSGSPFDALDVIKGKESCRVPFLPDSIKAGQVSTLSTGKPSISFTHHSSASLLPIQRTALQFDKLYERRAFHRNFDELSEADFTEARDHVGEIIAKYQEFETAATSESVYEDAAGE